jgi:hypothetical protein
MRDRGVQGKAPTRETGGRKKAEEYMVERRTRRKEGG